MAGTPAKTDELLTRLQPWLPTLQRLVPPGHGHHGAVDASTVAVSVAWFDGTSFFQPEAAQEPLNDVCEALSLLALLARVDLAMWKAVLRKIWPSDEPLREWMQGQLPTDLVIGFDVTGLSGRWTDGINRLRDHSTKRTGPSASYPSVRDFLESLGQVEGAEEVSWTKIRTRIELSASGMSSDTLAAILQHTIDMVLTGRKEGQKRAETQALAKPVFDVLHVEFASTVGVKLDNEGLRNLRQLTWLGVRVSHLPALMFDPSEADDLILVQAFRDIAGIDDCGNKDEVGVGSISISDRFAQAPIEALAATAQHSPTIHTVEIDLGNGEQVWFPDQRHDWKWVAYSIFSRYADHNIKTLKMSLAEDEPRLQEVEVEAVREILDAIDPLAILRGSNGSPPQLDAPRQLVASQFYLDNASGTPERPFQTRSEIAVRVLDTPKVGSYPWWSVILPGHGEAFVHKEDVISTSTTGIYNVNRPLATVPDFPHLDVLMSDESTDAVADLIEHIGQKTKRIDVDDAWGSSGDDEFCDRVLTACPELEELRMPNGNILDMGLFVTAAEARSVQLRVLELGCVEASDDAEELQSFFGALADPSHRLSLHLQELKLETILDTANMSELISLIVRILRGNRRLLRFHLNVHPDGDPGRVLPQWKAALAEFETEPMCIRTGPLGIQEKAAFLSVVEQKSQDSTSYMRQLDASVLTSVFQFAATGRVRDLRFTFGMGESERLVSSWSDTSTNQ